MMMLIISAFFIYILLASLWFIGAGKLTSDMASANDHHWDHLPTFSIIIPVRNEEQNLPTLIESLAGQEVNWEKGEVIFALNGCTDNSEKIIIDACRKYPFIKYLTVHYPDPYLSPKKQALLKALEICQGEIILQTDADTILPRQWILSHLRYHVTHRSMYGAFGLVRYLYPRGWLGRWLRADRFFTSVLSLSFAATGKPFLAFGANLSYRMNKEKHLPLLKSHMHILSGDDDLMIQRLATAGLKIGVLIQPQAAPITTLPDSWNALWRQRLRHVSAGKNYSFPIQLYYLFLVLFWWILLLSPLVHPAGFLLLGGKIMLDWFVWKKYSPLLPQKLYAGDLLLYECSYPLYITITAWYSLIHQATWE